MPVPAPTAPSSTDVPASATALATSSSSTCTARVVQPAVVALADHRDHHVVDADGRIGCDRNGDCAIHHAANSMGRREIDRRLEDAPLADLDRARQLAGAVEDGCAGRDGLLQEGLDRSREDRGQARAGDGRLVAPDRDVANRDAGDIGDRVPRAGVELADPQAVVAQAPLAHRPTIGSPDDARDARDLGTSARPGCTSRPRRTLVGGTWAARHREPAAGRRAPVRPRRDGCRSAARRLGAARGARPGARRCSCERVDRVGSVGPRRGSGPGSRRSLCVRPRKARCRAELALAAPGWPGFCFATTMTLIGPGVESGPGCCR